MREPDDLDAPVAHSPVSSSPPVAKRVSTTRILHGDSVVDDYAWLKDKDDPETIAYLEAENAYTEALTAHLTELRKQIFTEIKARTQETDLTVPARKGGYWYYSRTVEGLQYRIHCRRAVESQDEAPPATEDGQPLPGEEVLLNENELAGDSEFFALGTFDVSPDGRWLAFSTDYAGNERFTLRIKDLQTGDLLPDEVPDTFYGSAWSRDASSIFYVTVDEAWRPYRVWRHPVGSPPREAASSVSIDDPATGDDAAAGDVLVWQEDDERFWVSVGLTRSERFVVIQLGSNTTSEVRVVDAASPAAEPRLVRARKQGVEYSVDHQTGAAGDRFLILHNEDAINFELASAPVDRPDAWQPLIVHREDTRLLDVDAFADHLVVHFRRAGLTGLRIVPLAGDPQEIDFPEPIYSVHPGNNPDYATRSVRLNYASLVTPPSVYDYEIASTELVLRKRTPVLGGIDLSDYEQHRDWATASDGTRVPISLVCRKGIPRDGSAPCLLYGYGSYETSMDPWFSISRLSLLDRGFVFAVAHVRGGGEMGRRWYEDGKLTHKRNTFTDFVACAEHLISADWTARDRLVARGGSAGGLLMGAVANLAPEIFAGIVAEVPFVDALNTISDPSMPLTVIEWEEWGNPIADPEAYAYMKSYSPYENVAPVSYPAILAVTSLHDTRVLFHEPAKWVARLRTIASSRGPILLKTEMRAGHGGRSGRYDAWREEAFVVAWIIDTATGGRLDGATPAN